MSDTESNLEERDNELNKQMTKHPAEESVQILVKDAQRRTRQLRILTGSVIFQIFFLFGLAYGWYQNHEIALQAETNKNAIVRSCETSNDSRKNQLELWNYILSITPEQPRSEAQNKQAEEFRAFVNKTFAPRDCQKEINK